MEVDNLRQIAGKEDGFCGCLQRKCYIALYTARLAELKNTPLVEPKPELIS